MRILHTADWHLNDRLGRIRRQSDIASRLEEIAGYLEEHQVDVMIVAGDMFSQHTQLEELRDAMGDVNRIFKRFLMNGGTIVAISGNHDNEALFNLLRFALDLADPLDASRPGPRPKGRLYLAAQPTLLLLEDKAGQQVQFALFPYPTSARYLQDDATRYSSLDEKNRALHEALLARVRAMEVERIDPRLPSVLVSHIHVRGNQGYNLYHISEREDVIMEPGEIPTHWAYVAYGHIHKPQAMPGTDHVRYAGSIERLDLGEQNEDKNVTLVEVGPGGRTDGPVCLPLDATPIYHIEITDPATDIERLRESYADASRALVSYRLVYKPGTHNRDAICQQLEAVFPRWYRRDIMAEGTAQALGDVGPVTHVRDVRGTVLSYIRESLANAEEDRDEVLALAEQLLAEKE